MRADEVDYIVVGAGSSGCVLANRLSAHPGVRVALLEAGPSDQALFTNIKTAMPIGNIFLLPDSRFNWKYHLTGNLGCADRSAIPYPRGKLLGGCSSINGSVYIRGQAADYDAWKAAGNEGWSYDDILPEYREMERYRGASGRFHGTGGELDVQRPKSANPLAHAFVEAAVQAGYGRNEDFNGAQQEGFGRYDVNQRDGVRLSSSRSFLRPVRDRSNLQILTDTLVRRIIIADRRAVAVEVSQRNRRFRLRASREIILCAGAINSPQLLMLSGIGPAADLREFGIDVIQDLPGVGQNLHDHPTVYVAMENPTGEAYALSSRSFLAVLASPMRYLLARDGMLASNVAEAGGFLRTQESIARPDIQTTLLVALKSSALTIPRQHGYMVIVQLLRPSSRGSVKLSGPLPTDHPVIDPNFLETQEDLQALIHGIRAVRRILAQPALASMSGAELAPGHEAQSDAALEACIRATVTTAFHPACTCKMAPRTDRLAVVDERLRVHGLSGLRVADTSIMPDIISGNTSAPAMMIGARAAKLILADSRFSNISDPIPIRSSSSLGHSVCQRAAPK